MEYERKVQVINPYDELLNQLTGVEKTSSGHRAICPCHDDHNPSLHINIGDTQPVVCKCMACGAGLNEVCEKLGIPISRMCADNCNERVKKPSTKSKPKRTYATIEAATSRASMVWEYQSVDGEAAFWVARYDDVNKGKSYRPYHSVVGGIVCGDPEGKLPLYNLPALADAETVYFSEGEGCVDCTTEIGLVGTTTAHGSNAANAAKHDYTPLAGKHVILSPDYHDPGMKFARETAAILVGMTNPAKSVKILELPDLPDGGDIVDYVKAQRKEGWSDEHIGNTIQRLAAEANEYAPDDDDDSDDVGNDSSKQRGPTQSEILIKLAMQNVELLWHDSDQRSYATIPVGDHHEHYELKTRPFKRWLSRLFYEVKQKGANSQAMQDTLLVLEGEAVFKGPEHKVFVRYASHEDVIYIDLADDQWRVIKVTQVGWSVETESPVKFRRARGMLPLPSPAQGGDLVDLKQFLNYGNDSQFCLMLSWLVGALMPHNRPYPILELDGEQGSAKSTACKMLRALIDPNIADLRAAPKDERDIVIAAHNGHVLAFDNMSGCSNSLSDVLCRMATGAGFSTRELFSDAEEMLFSGARPVLVNGIGGVSSRPDLMDRTIRINLPRIEVRLDEQDLWGRFNTARPALLGALLDAVVLSLKHYKTIEIDELPRMADFAKFVAAAEPALPWEPGTFLATYAAARGNSDRDAVEASVIGPALVETLDKFPKGFTGTATVLLKYLCDTINCNDNKGTDNTRGITGWPRTAIKFSVLLKRIAPNLREMGYAVDLERRTNESRLYYLKPPSMGT